MDKLSDKSDLYRFTKRNIQMNKKLNNIVRIFYLPESHDSLINTIGYFSHKYDDDNKNMNNQNTQLLVIYKECGLGEELFFDNIKSLDKLKIE
ncbi:1752_t:CDS:2 [Entrophospora sp. SA101]|nr:1752_t:CDS:2 [Entrophospora sp. SA101]